MPSVSTNLTAAERAYLELRIEAEATSISAYLRRLVQHDMHRADNDALTALSLDAMAETQHAHAQSLAECQGLLHSGFRAVSDQLTELLTEEARNAERIMQANIRLLGVHESTSDLVTAVITDCRDILDATNTVVETIDRRLKSLGK